jgi:hypothetical protein
MLITCWVMRYPVFTVVVITNEQLQLRALIDQYECDTGYLAHQLVPNISYQFVHPRLQESRHHRSYRNKSSIKLNYLESTNQLNNHIHWRKLEWFFDEESTFTCNWGNRKCKMKGISNRQFQEEKRQYTISIQLPKLTGNVHQLFNFSNISLSIWR